MGLFYTARLYRECRQQHAAAVQAEKLAAMPADQRQVIEQAEARKTIGAAITDAVNRMMWRRAAGYVAVIGGAMILKYGLRYLLADDPTDIPVEVPEAS